MTKKRRQTLSNMKSQLETMVDQLTDLRTDEEIAFNGMPESLQGSLRGEESSTAIDVMQDVADLLEEAKDSLDQIV